MSDPESRKWRISRTLLRLLVYGYLAALIGFWLLIRLEGDRWWLATLPMYGPRWVYLLPLVVLVPAALVIRRTLLLPLAFGSCVTLISLMGFSVPVRSWANARPSDLRALSFNIERFKVAGDAFSSLLGQERPDVIAVQECAGVGRWTDWWQRHDEWHTVHRGELMVASRFPIKNVETSFNRWPEGRKPVLNAIYCVLSTPDGEIGFCNLHLDTPRRALSAVLSRDKILNLKNAEYADYRLECRRRESLDLLNWLQGFPEPKIIAGDFNMTSDSLIYRQDWKRFRDSFSWTGWGFGNTKQTIIRRQKYGLRIDRILTDSGWTPTRSWIGPDLGSDHSPLFAEIAKNKT